MPPSSTRSPDAAIALALRNFLQRGKVTQVHFAESGGTTPQPLAYFVHFPRLYLALVGRDEMWLEQAGQPRLLTLERGDAVVIPANCWNRPVLRGPGTALNFLFGRKQIGLSLVTQHTAGAKSQVMKYTVPGGLDGALRSIMQALLGLRADATNTARPLVEALVNATVDALTQPEQMPRRRATNLHESICMYVQEHFQLPMTRQTVAAHFRISANHVSRLFKREGMVSFNAYVGYVRLNWAKYLLKNHRQSVDEVAAMCGFSEASYFCRVFKEKTGLTPSAYRQTFPASGAPLAWPGPKAAMPSGTPSEGSSSG